MGPPPQRIRVEFLRRQILADVARARTYFRRLGLRS